MDYTLMRHRDNNAVIFWVGPEVQGMREIRSPFNALGFGSESPEEEGIPSPDLSARSGYFPAEAVDKYYEELPDDGA